LDLTLCAFDDRQAILIVYSRVAHTKQDKSGYSQKIENYHGAAVPMLVRLNTNRHWQKTFKASHKSLERVGHLD
jgi:uncharacterized protein YbgA (DUF1722 family)